MSRRMTYDFCIFTASKNISKFFRSFGTSLSSSAEVVVVGQGRGTLVDPARGQYPAKETRSLHFIRVT